MTCCFYRKRLIPIVFICCILSNLNIDICNQTGVNVSDYIIIDISNQTGVNVSDHISIHETEESPVPVVIEQRPISADLLTAVLVEIRCHAGILIVLEQAIAHLGPSVSITVWHSKENEVYLKKIMEQSILSENYNTGQIVLRRLDPVRFGTMKNQYLYAGGFWYSKLMTSLEFWKDIKTPFAMTLQADTLICRPVMDEDLKGTYIGGISGFKTIWNPKLALGNTIQHIDVGPNPDLDIITISHLNGGFSLRNVTWVRQCIRKYGGVQDWVEDSLMQYCHERLGSSKPVLEKDAYAFSSDNGHSMCHVGNANGDRICPLAVHKPWMTKKNKTQYEELEKACPGLGKLEKLQYIHGEHVIAPSSRVRGASSSDNTTISPASVQVTGMTTKFEIEMG